MRYFFDVSTLFIIHILITYQQQKTRVGNSTRISISGENWTLKLTNRK